MNERIRELALQAGINFYKKPVLNKDYPELYNGVYCESELGHQQKFAELIVKECCQIVLDCSIPGSNNERDFVVTAREIKQHFGVEE